MTEPRTLRELELLRRLIEAGESMPHIRPIQDEAIELLRERTSQPQANEYCGLCMGTGRVADDVTQQTVPCKCSQPQDAREALLDKYRIALENINAIRNSIVGFQNVGTSEHIYPLVAALNEAGFQGKPYEECKKEVAEMLAQRAALKGAHVAQDAREKLRAKVQTWANNCAVYEKQHIEEGSSSEYHRGAKEAFERVSQELEKL